MIAVWVFVYFVAVIAQLHQNMNAITKQKKDLNKSQDREKVDDRKEWNGDRTEVAAKNTTQSYA